VATASEVTGLKILIIEDDVNIARLIELELGYEGYQVSVAHEGNQGLDLFKKDQPDLVLLDLNMPVKNGWDTFERLTAEHPFIPIIIATARPNQLFTALNAGVGALLEKPMDIPTLLRTMENLLAESVEQRVARLAGKNSEFTYKPAPGSHEKNRQSFQAS